MDAAYISQPATSKGSLLNALKLLMIVTFAEATSWLGLLAGMIAKYGFDSPRGVEIMGPVHGFLFVAFAFMLVITHMQERWPVTRTLIAFIESIPPFLGFFLGKRLLDEVRQQSGSTQAATS
jgi:integral membrane protein